MLILLLSFLPKFTFNEFNKIIHDAYEKNVSGSVQNAYQKVRKINNLVKIKSKM